MIEKVISFRKFLHQYPDLSGKEINTASLIKDFIQQKNPAQIIEQIGGAGLLAVFEFGEGGATILIRCELDALPIVEKNNFEHRSQNEGVSHKCGHDGHMAIVAGLIFWISDCAFDKGKILLLFQPAEETGKGALMMLNDKKLENIKPDYVFALHNLPGEPMHSVIVKTGYFSASVQSLIVKLKGIQAHASEPENGINPALAIAEIVESFSGLNEHNPQSDDFFMITVIHMLLGEKNYGIAPGEGELHFTLRTWSDQKMREVEQVLKDRVKNISKKYRLSFELEWLEYFPSIYNHPDCVALIKKAASANGLEIKKEVNPLRFGEDFGWFSQKYKSAMFGLGAGLHTPALHHVEYDFPDELLETGMNLFKSIISEIFNSFEE